MMRTRSDYNEQITKNFALHEFVFSTFYSPRVQERVCETFDDEPELHLNVRLLALNLQVLREYLGCAVSINIAFRPEWWEHKQGRSGNSQHTKAWAADIVAEENTPAQVADAIEYLIETGKMKQGGLGRYNSFTHYDLYAPDFDGRRWDYT